MDYRCALHSCLQKRLAVRADILLCGQVLSLNHLFDELDILIVDFWSPVHRDYTLVGSLCRILSIREIAWFLGLSGLELAGGGSATGLLSLVDCHYSLQVLRRLPLVVKKDAI